VNCVKSSACNLVKMVEGVSVNEVVTDAPDKTEVESHTSGTVVAQGKKQGGVKTGWANATTMELTHVNGDDALPEVVEQHKFSMLLWLPLTSTPMVIFHCGIDGFWMGVREGQDQYGYAFHVVLAIDNDPLVIDIHQSTFKGVNCVKYTLGGSKRATLDLVERYLPRARWRESSWHGSPSCKEGSSANLFKQDFKAFRAATRWIVGLFLLADPGDWSVEQVPRAFNCLLDVPVWKTQLDMQKHVGLSSVRKRTIVANTSLQLKELTIDEMRQEFLAPQLILVLKSGMGYVRSAAEPAFTVTSNAQAFGHRTNDMQRIRGTVMLQLIGVDADRWSWPEGTAETTKLKLGAQVVPPKFAAYLQLAKHNSRIRNASSRSQLENFLGGGGGNDVKYLPDVRMVKVHGVWCAGRIAKETPSSSRRAGRMLICIAKTMEARWYYTSKVHSG